MFDYHFPTTFYVFTKNQEFKRNNTTLAIFPANLPFSFLDIVGVLNHGISGINIHHLRDVIHIQNGSSTTKLYFSSELEKVLNVHELKPVGINYCIKESLIDYHVSLIGMDLGLYYEKIKTKPSELLAVLPSRTMCFPLFEFEPKLYNYIDLEITSHGRNVNFDNESFKIVLKIIT